MSQKSLLIAEKPSVAQSYRQLLEKAENEKFTKKDGYWEGQRFDISWCVGHLVALSEPESYGWKHWNLDDLPMIPQQWQYEVLPNTQKQFDILARLVAKAADLINGTDAGREGELIYRLLVHQCGAAAKPQRRLWLNSFVMNDMLKAWQNLRPATDFNHLAASAIVRAKADWLLGMNASRGYAVGTGKRGLSVGRVQTPTLALVVQRDEDVEKWTDKYFYQLQCTFRKITFLYIQENQQKFDKPDALQLVKTQCEGKIGEIVQVSKNEKRHYPPKPFDLAALQKEANKKWGFKAADTLKHAQHLYENKLITYPRTDSEYLPDSMKNEAIQRLHQLSSAADAAYFDQPLGKQAFFNSAKVSDHFAIIPTADTSQLAACSDAEQKIYQLVRERFITAFFRPYVFEEYIVLMQCEQHYFKAKIIKVLDAGFKERSQQLPDETAATDEAVTTLDDPAFALRQGDRDLLRDLEILKKKATPPKRYSEASLLTAMETAGRALNDESLRDAMKERGLGTPATKAAIIETLKDRGYLDTHKKNLISTAKGRELIALVDEKVKSPEMTGEWEYKLNKIAKGEYKAQQFLSEIEDYLRSLNSGYRQAQAEYFKLHSADMLLCPKCKQGTIKQLDEYWVCSRGKEHCGFIAARTVAGKKLNTKQMEQLIKTGETEKLSGFTSKKGTAFEAVLRLDENGKVVFKF